MPTPRTSYWTPICLLAAIMLLGPAGGGAERPDPVSLDVRVGARAVAPGEPLRIHVTASEPLDGLAATLLDGAIFLTRTDESGLRWSGWSMIGLDEAPGDASIDLHGSARDGRDVRGTRTIRIASKQFPEENLSVAPSYVEPPPEVQARIARERAKLARIYQSRQPVPPPSEPFVRPVPGINTSIFGMRRLFNGKPRSPHSGLDLRAASGTPVQAAGPGRVVLAEELYYSGNLVIVDHGGGLFTLYGHLSSIEVAAGDQAEAGDLVGLSGATGRVTGPHLHWGAKIGNRPFDPEALLVEALF